MTGPQAKWWRGRSEARGPRYSASSARLPRQPGPMSRKLERRISTEVGIGLDASDRQCNMGFSLLRQPEKGPRLSGQMPVAQNGGKPRTFRFVHNFAQDPVRRRRPRTNGNALACIQTDISLYSGV
mgnify:CR=1 FL=1